MTKSKSNKKQKVQSTPYSRTVRDGGGVNVVVDVNAKSKSDGREIERAIGNLVSEVRDGDGIPLVETDPADQDNELMKKMFELAKRQSKVTLTVKKADSSIDLRTWPDTNLEYLPVGNEGQVAFREVVPQYSKEFPGTIGLVSDFPTCTERMGLQMCKIWNIMIPHHYVKPKVQFDDVIQDRLCLNGFNLRVLRNNLLGRASTMDHASTVTQLMNGCRYRSRYTPDGQADKFTDKGYGCLVDGSIRGRVLKMAQRDYSQSFRRASEVLEEKAAEIPVGWQLGRLNAIEENALVYAEEPEPIEADQINTLGRAAPSLLLDVCREYARGLSIQFQTASEASSNFTAAIRLSATTSSDLRRFINYVDEQSAKNFVVRIVCSAVLLNSTVAIDITYFEINECNVLTAFIIILMFPRYMLDATTERNCIILLRCILDTTRSATAYENMTDAQLYGCPCELISSRAHSHPIYLRWTGASPYTTDSRYKVPLLFNVGGTHVNANAPRQFAQVAGGVRRMHSTCINAMMTVANMIDGSRTLIQDLFVRIGIIAAVIPAPWKNCPSSDPIVIHPNEVRSGVMLFKGMGEIDSTSVLKHVGAVMRDINGQFSRMRQTARVFSKYANNAGVSTVDAITLADDYAKQLDAAMGKDPTGGAILEKMRQTLGKSSVRDFIRNTVNQVEFDHQRNSMRVLRNVMKVFRDNPSTFGVSPYLYLSTEPVINNVQGVYGDVFVGGEHPFRHLPSDLRNVSAHNLLCMSYDGVANLLNAPVCVKGHFTYDLAVSHEDYNPEFTLNTYPILVATIVFHLVAVPIIGGTLEYRNN